MAIQYHISLSIDPCPARARLGGGGEGLESVGVMRFCAHYMIDHSLSLP
jgi:hypothetical protein